VCVRRSGRWTAATRAAEVLGLWICRQIGESHRTWIDSGPDGGAVFVFALRRVEGEPTGQDDVTHRT
jgi:signal transduction histidine kinase